MNTWKKIQYLLVGLTFIGCQSEGVSEDENKTVSPGKIKETRSLEEDLTRQVESILKISAAEQYDIQIIKEYIDRDTIIDAVILVNRAEHALTTAKQNDNLKFLEYLGFTGPHNHVFVYLGGSKQLLQSPPVGSSIHHPLTVHFERISSPAQKDFFVDYRSRNSMYRNYYTVRNNKLLLTFNCPVFDEIGSDEPVVYAIEHLESSVRIGKDIALFFGKIKNYNKNKIEDINNFTPEEILKTDELFVYFIFDDKEMVYKTPMRREEVEVEN